MTLFTYKEAPQMAYLAPEYVYGQNFTRRGGEQKLCWVGEIDGDMLSWNILLYGLNTFVKLEHFRFW